MNSTTRGTVADFLNVQETDVAKNFYDDAAHINLVLDDQDT